MATICKEIQEWVEEKIEKSISEWVAKTEEKCSDYDWWNPVGWFCWIVTVFVSVVKIIVIIIGKWIPRIVCEIVAFILTILAAIVNFIYAFPIIGPILKARLRTIINIVSYGSGLLDGFGRLLGIQTTKHLRVHVIPLAEGVIPLVFESHLNPIMTETARIFYDRAQIKLHTTIHEPLLNPPENALRLGTEVDLITDELWLKGSWHQIQTIKLFESNFLSLFSVGHPVIVYIVREVGYDGPGKVIGASGGPFTDWVAVERNSVIPQVVADANRINPTIPLSPYPPIVATTFSATPVANPNYAPRVIAHEICHSLGLLGHANSVPGDLMVPDGITGDALSPFQVGIIRNSSHVTFF